MIAALGRLALRRRNDAAHGNVLTVLDFGVSLVAVPRPLRNIRAGRY